MFEEVDAAGFDRFTQLHAVISGDMATVQDGIDAESAFDLMTADRRAVATVLDDEGRLIGVVTRKGALRSTIYRPALDANGRLMIAVAVGINGDIESKAKALIEMGADVLVIDTAHGHQTRTLQAIETRAERRARHRHRRRQRRHGQPAPASSSTPGRTSSRWASDRARCARPG